MPGGAARQDDDTVDRLQPVVRDLELAQEHVPGLERSTTEHRFLNCPRLLENLLQHEVLVTGLLRHHRVPGNALGRRLDRDAGEIGERYTVGCDDRHFLIAEEHDVAGMAQHSRDV